MIDSLLNWIADSAARHDVDPFIFGTIYLVAIPLFIACSAWLVRAWKRGRSIVLPAACAALTYFSSYIYLFAAGDNLPIWMYGLVGGMIGVGGFSTLRTLQNKMDDTGETEIEEWLDLNP